MSETKKTNNIPEKTFNYVAFGKGKEIKILAANEQTIDGVPGIPMLIETGNYTVTNETKDGRAEIINNDTGKSMGYIGADGTLNRKLEEKDRARAEARLKEGIGRDED